MTTNERDVVAMVAALHERPSRMAMLRAKRDSEPEPAPRDAQPLRMTMLRRPVE